MQRELIAVQPTQQPVAPHEPILDLGTLPAASIHKYLVYNGILPPEPLTHEHAVRPLPPTLHAERPQKRLRIDADPEAPEAEQSELPPPASEAIAGPPPLGNAPGQADRRLVAQAIAHWNQTPTVKEGEAISGFMLAVRKRRILNQVVVEM